MEQQHRGINVRTVMTGVFAVTMTVGAFYLLHHFTDEITLSQVISDIRATPVSAIILSICATIISFTAIAFYEILAVRTVAPGRISYKLAAWPALPDSPSPMLPVFTF